MADSRSTDSFLRRYDDSELRIASEFLSTWLPFLSRDLCRNCTQNLSRRIHSLSSQRNHRTEPSYSGESSVIQALTNEEEKFDNCDKNSLGSWNDEAETNSLGSWKGEADEAKVLSKLGLVDGETPKVRKSWADMAQEDDELEGEVSSEERKGGDLLNGDSGGGVKKKTELSRDQREHLRFMNVRRKKDFACLERVNGKFTNIVQGIELHTGVFSAVEQNKIVDCVYDLVEMGKNGELKERTFSAPRKWMKGKGRVTIQFGCCYNYAIDKFGNPPGILKNDDVDPLPSLFKVIIKRLIGWHVIPPSCVPDSCIVNIYEEGDCIPPHIDHHDFVRPFCTISFLSECNILFGTDLKILGPGEFSGAMAIPLPVGSVLVLNGNGADIAKHCVPGVPTKRISITFRRMDDSKRPSYYSPDPELQGLEPLPYEDEGIKKSSPPRSVSQRSTRGGFRSERNRGEEPRSEGKWTEDSRSEWRRSEEPRLERRRSEEPRLEQRRSEEPRSEQRRPAEPRPERKRSEEPYSDWRRADEPRSERRTYETHSERKWTGDSRPEMKWGEPRSERKWGQPRNPERYRAEEPRYSARNRASVRISESKVNTRDRTDMKDHSGF